MKTLRLFLSLAIPLWAVYALYENWSVIAKYALMTGLVVGCILVAVAVIKVSRANRTQPEPRATMRTSARPPVMIPQPQPNSQWYGPQPSIPGGLVPNQQPKAQWIDLPSNQYETELEG